ncbi:heme utilization protein [Methylobacterium sp. WL18]|uniref:heme utilization protein n=1 Tax=Methylobacterium sp. WL18 TaxID=2603897 RepID=UPI001FEF696C|nr:heme utilization protein [Methylobacterium sp. WL18]
MVKQNLMLSMARISVPILAIAISAGLLCPADAAVRKVKIPNQYDGSWTIIAATAQGPCSASTSYQVQIKGSDASIPGDEIDIDGGVAAGGAVKATITKGANRVPIAGSLSTKGSGSGTWRTSGGLIECSGSWSAKRAG